jgi:hypothetical protein
MWLGCRARRRGWALLHRYVATLPPETLVLFADAYDVMYVGEV